MKPTKDGKNGRPQKNSGFSLQKKEEIDGYEVKVGKRIVILFNPEKCLKVGRHYGRLGIVYTVPTQKSTQCYYWGYDNVTYHKTDRGLVKWNGIDPESLAFSSIKLAVELSGLSNPPKWLMDKIVTAMSLDDFWKDLTFRMGLGKELEAVSEVMKA